MFIKSIYKKLQLFIIFNKNSCIYNYFKYYQFDSPSKITSNLFLFQVYNYKDPIIPAPIYRQNIDIIVHIKHNNSGA